LTFPLLVGDLISHVINMVFRLVACFFLVARRSAGLVSALHFRTSTLTWENVVLCAKLPAQKISVCTRLVCEIRRYKRRARGWRGRPCCLCVSRVRKRSQGPVEGLVVLDQMSEEEPP